MVFTTKLCALPTVDPWLINLGPRLVNKAGVCIFFHGKVRNPPRVDNVVRGNKKAYFFPSRNNQGTVNFQQVVICFLKFVFYLLALSGE